MKGNIACCQCYCWALAPLCSSDSAWILGAVPVGVVYPRKDPQWGIREKEPEYPAPAALPKQEEILEIHTPESPGLRPKNPL